MGRIYSHSYFHNLFSLRSAIVSLVYFCSVVHSHNHLVRSLDISHFPFYIYDEDIWVIAAWFCHLYFVGNSVGHKYQHFSLLPLFSSGVSSPELLDDSIESPSGSLSPSCRVKHSKLQFHKLVLRFSCLVLWISMLFWLWNKPRASPILLFTSLLHPSRDMIPLRYKIFSTCFKLVLSVEKQYI